MKTDKPLSAKHKRFVILAAAGHSATAAYALAYNIPNSNYTRAASCRLMKDERIQSALVEARQRITPIQKKTAKNAPRSAPKPAAPKNSNESVNIFSDPAEPETRPTAAQLEADLREKLRQQSGAPETVNRFTLPPPKYQRPTPPNDMEALRRRVRAEMATAKTKGEW